MNTFVQSQQGEKSFDEQLNKPARIQKFLMLDLAFSDFSFLLMVKCSYPGMRISNVELCFPLTCLIWYDVYCLIWHLYRCECTRCTGLTDLFLFCFFLCVFWGGAEFLQLWSSKMDRLQCSMVIHVLFVDRQIWRSFSMFHCLLSSYIIYSRPPTCRSMHDLA